LAGSDESAWKRVAGRLLPRGEFGRNVMTVASGTALAQLLPLLVAPVLTRVYTPADFGTFALYLAAATVLGALATGRYELAVMLPARDETAVMVVRLCVVIAAASALVALLGALFVGRLVAKALASESLAPWLLLVGPSVFLTGVSQSAIHWSNRRKCFRRVARARIAQSVVAALASIAMATVHDGPGGLIVGYVLGQLVGTVGLVVVAIRRERLLLRRSANASDTFRAVACRYRDFPRYQGPSALLEAFAGQLPIVLLTSFFGSATAGFVSLSQRAVRLPVSVVGRAIGDVFRQRASEDWVRDGRCDRIFGLTFRRLAALAWIPLAILAVLAPWLFEWVFGAEWRTAGGYARILSGVYFLQFVVSPLSFVFMIAERQKADLALQIALVVLTTTAIAAGHLVFASATAAVALLALAYSMKYVVELMLAYSFSRGISPATARVARDALDCASVDVVGGKGGRS